MDVRATKDHYELETDEAERLVRPAPKVKPSRHDKKREDVHERDSDTDGDPDLKGDPDMSVNFKDVGGSLVERVVSRFATKPKDEQDKPKSDKWVKVRNKMLDHGTRVRPETLVEKPSLYEKKLPNEPPEEAEGKPRPSRKPERPHFKKDPIPHPPWPEPRPMPPKPERPARPPKAVKLVPVRRYPEPENPPKPKPPGWVPDRRKPASMVVARFLQATEFGSKEELAKYLKDHPDADPKLHSVRVEEEKTQEDIDDENNPELQKEIASGKRYDQMTEAGAALVDLAKGDPKLTVVLEGLQDSKSYLHRPEHSSPGARKLHEIADQKPDTKLDTIEEFGGVKFPPGISTMGDLVEALDRAEGESGKPLFVSKKRQEREDEADAEAARRDERRQKPEAPASPGTEEQGHALRELAKGNPALEAKLKDFARPDSNLAGLAKGNPDLPAKTIFPGVSLPPGVSTVGDVARVLALSTGKKPKTPKTPKEDAIVEGIVPEPQKPTEKPEVSKVAPDEKKTAPEGQSTPKSEKPAKVDDPKQGKPKPAPKAPDRDNYESDEEFSSAQEQHEAEVESRREELEGRAKAPKPKRDQFNSEEEYEKALKSHKKDISEAQAALGGTQSGPKPKRRKPSKEEVAAMQHDIRVSGYPLEIASKLYNIHPDDYQQIKASAATHAQVPIRSDKLDEHVERMTSNGLYQLDPAKVPAPKQAKDATGKMVPFESLSHEEKQEAWAQFQNETVAASLALRAQVTSSFRTSGVPKDLAAILARAKLGGGTPGNVSDDVMELGHRDSMSPKARLKVLEKIKNPKDQQLAVQYFQGQDYLDVRNEFLNPSSDSGVSEYSSSRDLKRALEMGSSMLSERAKAYPDEFRDPDMASRFRHRVLRKMEALDPAKAVRLQRDVDEMDATDYERAQKDFKSLSSKAESDLKKREQQRDKLKVKYEAAVAKQQEQASYREPSKAEKTLEETWAEKGLDPKEDPTPPKTPRKPARYDLLRGTIPKAKDQHADLLAQTEEPEHEVTDDELETVPSKKTPPPFPSGKTKQASARMESLASRVAGRFLAFSLVRVE